MATPTLLTISPIILAGYTEQEECKLFSLNTDVLRMILLDNTLTIFDQACLMLSCKKLANLVYAIHGTLSISDALLAGNEEQVLEMQRDNDYGIDWSLDEEEVNKQLTALKYAFQIFLGKTINGNSDCISRLEAEYARRNDANMFDQFYQRLDRGWNKSASQWCHGCSIFRSAERSYWNKKATAYVHKQTGAIAKRWRLMLNMLDGTYGCRCTCHPDPNEFINIWTSHFERKAKEYSEKVEVTRETLGSVQGSAQFWYIPCPECAIREISDVHCMRDHNDLDHGCSDCGCQFTCCSAAI